MSMIGTAEVRTTTMQIGNQLLASLRQTQRALAEIQQQVSTGRKIEKPSDSPAFTSTILMLESSVEQRLQHQRNLQHALGVLNTTDQALGDATNILLEVKGIASSQVGIGSNTDTRANQSTVIDAMIHAMIDLSNRQFQGISLFGGNQSAKLNQPVFEEFGGGIRYIGARTNLAGDVGSQLPLPINVNGQDAFAALSSRVQSKVDLDPNVTTRTRITDTTGAQGVAIRLGNVRVSVDDTEVLVDLQTADTLGDVVIRIQSAIDGITGGGSGILETTDSGFLLTADTGQILTIEGSGSGQTAADLGIAIMSANGSAVHGAALDAKLTSRTELSALGASIDFVSGMKITQGTTTKIADFSSAVTIEDMINEIDQFGLGVRMEINQNQAHLNLVSEVSGLELSIGENGGTTAGDLGLRTFEGQTRLANMRFELGVESVPGENDFRIQLHDASTFDVNLDGLTTVQDVIDAIHAAAVTAGLTAGDPGTGGTAFNVGLVPDGNGFQFEDNTVGAGDFRVLQLGNSLSATHLGIYTNAGTENVIIGDDVNKVRSDSVLTHLINLRDSLLNDDSLGITLAGDALDTDLENLARTRADVGTRAQRTEQQQQRTQDLMTSERTFLSEIRDTDLTEAITRLLQLQQQLQASLSVGASNLQLSLLDFLR